MIAEHLNRTVWARLAPSAIHGIGVIAIRDIPAGQLITDYTYKNVRGHGEFAGPREQVFYETDEREFMRILPEIRDLILDRILWADWHPMKFISPNHDQFLQSFMNHSDDPNTDNCIALMNIKKGEELTEDFRNLYDVPHHLTKQHHAFLYGPNPGTKG